MRAKRAECLSILVLPSLPSINVTTPQKGDTALIWAVRNGYNACTVLVIQAGGRLEGTNKVCGWD